MFLFIFRLLYNEIVTLSRLMLFITNYLYNKLIQNTITQLNFLLKPLLTDFLKSFANSNEVNV